VRKIGRVFSVVLAAHLVIAVAFAQSDVDKRAAMEKKIAELVVEKLGPDARTIRVTVVGNKATLTGEVTNNATRELAEEVALAVDGIKKVDNQVKATAEPGFGTKKIGQESKDSKLELEVKDKLGNEIGSYAKGIEVEVAGGWTTLRGTVPDKTRKDLALKAAASVPGITKVIDLIRIKA
jgi:hyperosmotically inducible protein